jgi:cation diffusion facilitator CzcD-associated flavoprotein CzcO
MTAARGTLDAAVVGAGPYGLAVAAHLKHRGMALRIFGTPMSFWRAMPESISLKSPQFSTNVYVPRRHYTYSAYCRTHGLGDDEPFSMASFADYGLWVQRTLLPEVEPVDVAEVRDGSGDGFELRLQGGETLRARSVVIATGLAHFAQLPAALADLPAGLVSHTADHPSYAAFAGKDVAVLGAGASALEAATLLLEAGARPLLLVREARVILHTKFDPNRALLTRLRDPNSALGTGRKSWVMEHFPLLLHYVPEARRVRFTRAYLGPAGPWWLRARFEGKVPLRLRAQVRAARARGSRVELDIEVAGESGRAAVTPQSFDHVVAGTGYEADLARLPFLTSLASRIGRVGTSGSPRLSSHFESTIPGLYFAGPAAALGFGPLFRFVAGAKFAAPRVAHHISRK